MKRAILLRDGFALGLIMAGAAFFWPRVFRRADSIPHPRSGCFVTARAMHPAGPPRRASAPESADARRMRTLARVHDRLRQLDASLASYNADKDGSLAEQSRLMKELQNLLTRQNELEIIRSLSPQELDTPFGRWALSRWLDADPIGAARWIASRSGGTDDQAWLVAHKLLEDSAKLQSFCQDLPDSAWTRGFYADLSQDVAAFDPVLAIELAQKMNAGPAQTALLQGVAGYWTTIDPGAAIDWIRSIGDETVQSQVIVSAARSLAETEPDEAAKMLSLADPTIGLNDAVLGVVDIWSQKDPATAADWVATMPWTDIRTPAIRDVYNHWRTSDPAAAARWVRSQPGGAGILEANGS